MSKATLLILLIAVCILVACSSQTVSTGEDKMKDLAEMADQQRKSAEAAAQKLLKQPIEVPYPPSISLKCHHDTEAKDEPAINSFIEDFNEPELEVLSRAAPHTALRISGRMGYTSSQWT